MENRYKNGKKIVRVAVNLSRMDLMDGEIMDLIIDDVKMNTIQNRWLIMK